MSEAGTRLDVWLWAARFFKTRSIAKHAIETGKVEIGGQRAKPSRLAHVGDAIVVVRGEERFEIAVRGLSDTRGPAPVAQALYETKPDKRARRLIRALGDIDAM